MNRLSNGGDGGNATGREGDRRADVAAVVARISEEGDSLVVETPRDESKPIVRADGADENSPIQVLYRERIALDSADRLCRNVAVSREHRRDARFGSGSPDQPGPRCRLAMDRPLGPHTGDGPIDQAKPGFVGSARDDEAIVASGDVDL